MASLEEALWTELKDDSAISAKVKSGNNYAIYYDDVPNGVLGSIDYMVVISKISEDQITFLDYQTTNIQITAISENKSGVISLKDDIIRVLNRFKGSLGSKRDVKSVKKLSSSSLKADNSKHYMEILEFSFNHFGDNV
jgi:hypothetical protein